MLLIRPADANEAVAAWKIAVEHQGGPVTLVMSRQKLPILDLDHYPQLPLGVKAGGYVLEHVPTGTRPDIALVATGSEVHLALAARLQLEKEGLHARVVSFPSWHLFERQPKEYQEDVLPSNMPMLAIEAGVSLGWKPYIGQGIPVIGVDTFGASAPAEVLLQEYGFNVDNVCNKVRQIVQEWKARR
jgi:transketolase